MIPKSFHTLHSKNSNCGGDINYLVSCRMNMPALPRNKIEGFQRRSDVENFHGNKSLLHSEKHITAFTLWKEICKSQMNVFMATCGLLRSETPNSNGKCLNKHKIKCYSSDHQNEMNASRFSTGPFSLFHGCCTVATHRGVIPDGHVVLRVKALRIYCT
jgi:hypothetical protein